MFKDMTVKARMRLLEVVMVLFTVVIGLIGLLSAVSLSSKLDEINTGGVLATRYLANAQDAMWQLRYGISQYLAVPDPEKRKKIIDESPKWFGLMDENLKMYSVGDLSAEAKSALNDMMGIYNQYKDARPKWLALMEAGEISEAAEFRSKTILISGAGTVKALGKLIEMQTSRSDQMNKASKTIAGKAKMQIIAGVLILIFSSLAIARWITRNLLRELGGEPHYVTEVVRRIANGDLTVSVNTLDNDRSSLLASMKEMVENLKKTVQTINITSGSMASNSQQLSSTVLQITTRITEQTDRTNHIATSATEMSQSVIDIARNASNIATVATDTATVANEGRDIVNKTGNEVKAIASTVNESAQLMADLGVRSKQIGEIVSVINDIADQTNLLALNAAIEAARAGEQGRGFAVVADEVRKLAEKTAKATSEIGGMIKAIQNDIEGAVKSMDEGTKRVEDGVEFSAQAGLALGNIVKSVAGLQSMVQQIASATEQMSAVTETVSTDIETVASVSKETGDNANGIVQAANSLAILSEDLKKEVQKFKLS